MRVDKIQARERSVLNKALVFCHSRKIYICVSVYYMHVHLYLVLMYLGK